MPHWKELIAQILGETVPVVAACKKCAWYVTPANVCRNGNIGVSGQDTKVDPYSSCHHFLKADKEG